MLKFRKTRQKPARMFMRPRRPRMLNLGKVEPNPAKPVTAPKSALSATSFSGASVDPWRDLANAELRFEAEKADAGREILRSGRAAETAADAENVRAASDGREGRGQGAGDTQPLSGERKAAPPNEPPMMELGAPLEQSPHLPADILQPQPLGLGDGLPDPLQAQHDPLIPAPAGGLPEPPQGG